MGRHLIAFCLVLIVAGGGVLAYNAITEGKFLLAPVILIVMSMMLSALPLLIRYVQTTPPQRQLEKLQTLNNRDVSNRPHFKIAYATLQSIKPAIFDQYALPTATFAFVIIFCWLMTNAVYFKPEYFYSPNVVLGGLTVLSATDSAEIMNYQRGTFVAGCFGFIGAYIYTNWRLLDRINNNDIYPISFYYYAARLLAACIIAGRMRHIIPEYGTNVSVILLSFAVGFIPDILITSLVRRASQVIKTTSDQPDPALEALPRNSSLLMIQGMDRDKIDRLTQFYETNAEVLACQNPLILWLRLPYELLLIINWISHAQLYRLMPEEHFVKLRQAGICGSLDFFRIGSAANALPVLASIIQLPTELIEAILGSMQSDPLFVRLLEVQDALRQPAK
ncbi:hypothetical protein [Bradyrhizobium centrosematis]|uniref:hypothetical protein n=1 Tax=Bradyrhizobium centrosematis TaxID=1300039 RepID=UPI00388E7B87